MISDLFYPCLLTFGGDRKRYFGSHWVVAFGKETVGITIDHRFNI
jgi:hypothetical protein